MTILQETRVTNNNDDNDVDMYSAGDIVGQTSTDADEDASSPKVDAGAESGSDRTLHQWDGRTIGSPGDKLEDLYNSSLENIHHISDNVAVDLHCERFGLESESICLLAGIGL
ncbi:hypothetical protein ColLi_12683 [Colletotrichum liriopes]|uniref:Uncharacterized protein n=1 Tax=Colletotrichum liriopes TaxID=708192 RepID=A0AA37LY31_9PEZI|nr:hypothetical protein ColLi_12683 [Colletotrichum liriopes]